MHDATALIPLGRTRAELLAEREAICDAIAAAQSTDHYDPGIECAERSNQRRLGELDRLLAAQQPSADPETKR